MNKISRIIAGISTFAVIIIFNSCVKDKFDALPATTPTVDFAANTTIAQLNQYYIDSLGSGFGIIDDDLIVKGKIVANDESGNIYKTLYLEDANSGIQIAIDQNSLFNTFRLGQTVYIKCKGLYMGNYGGVPQLGYLYNGAIGRIPSVYIKDHFFLDGMPGDVPAPVLKSAFSFTTADLSMLIRIDSVTFVPSEIGKVFSDPSATTDRLLYDKNLGTTIAIRTSNYADFAGEKIPNGVGSIVGIYSTFNGAAQFYIRSMDDLIGFAGLSPIIANETFAVSGSLGTFTQYSVTGNEKWAESSYSGTYFAKMSGYSGGVYSANEDWLISPSMNLDNYINEKLTFFTEMNYGAAGDGSLKVLYSSDYTSGDPNSATWNDITSKCALSAGAWALTQSGNVDLSAVTGTNVHIAFKYTCGTSNVSTWELGGFIVKGSSN